VEKKIFITGISQNLKGDKMKKIFITGISGFIGKYLSKKLIEEGDYEIHGLVEKDPDRDLGFEYTAWAGSLTDFDLIGKYLEEINPHFIIHLAARTEVEKSFYDPIHFQTVNYDGTVNLIEKSKNLSNLELFVFSSTMETYGAVPKSEWVAFDEDTKQYPNAPYAVAKIGCEYYLRYAERSYDFPFTALRQTNTYGRWDNDFFVVEQIITQMLNNPDEISLGYRQPYRNFLFIDDLINLYTTVLKNVDLAKGEIFCTGPDNAIQIKELADVIGEKLNWKGKIMWGTKPPRAGEIYYLNSTAEKARRILNWGPETDLDSGLDKTIEMWRGRISTKATDG
jgi:UDP-glucose 4-epimerase